VRHETRDDITDAVVAWLNKQYAAAGGAAGLSAAPGSAAGSKVSVTKPTPRDVPAPGSRKATSR
jgi:hypothetical protein